MQMRHESQTEGGEERQRTCTRERESDCAIRRIQTCAVTGGCIWRTWTLHLYDMTICRMHMDTFEEAMSDVHMYVHMEDIASSV